MILKISILIVFKFVANVHEGCDKGVSGVLRIFDVILKILLNGHVVRGESLLLSHQLFDEVDSKSPEILSQPAIGNEQEIAMDAVNRKGFYISSSPFFFGGVVGDLQYLEMNEGGLDFHQVLASLLITIVAAKIDPVCQQVSIPFLRISQDGFDLLNGAGHAVAQGLIFVICREALYRDQGVGFLLGKYNGGEVVALHDGVALAFLRDDGDAGFFQGPNVPVDCAHTHAMSLGQILGRDEPFGLQLCDDGCQSGKSGLFFFLHARESSVGNAVAVPFILGLELGAGTHRRPFGWRQKSLSKDPLVEQ